MMATRSNNNIIRIAFTVLTTALATLTKQTNGTVFDQNPVMLVEVLASGVTTLYFDAQKDLNFSNFRLYGGDSISPSVKRQLYTLGKKWIRDYPGFFERLGTTYLSVRALRSSRTLYSAEAHLSALIPRPKKPGFKLPFTDPKDPRYRAPGTNLENLDQMPDGMPYPGDYLPVSISSDYFLNDTFFNLQRPQTCKNISEVDIDEETKRIYDLNPTIGKDFNEVLEELQFTIPKEGWYGTAFSPLLRCMLLSEAMIFDYYSNPNSKVNFSKPSHLNVKGCSEAYYMANMTTTNNTRLGGSALVVDILGNLAAMDYSKEHPGTPHLEYFNKFALYVGQRMNLAQLLTILGVFDRDCLIMKFKNGGKLPPGRECTKFPEHASSLIFEQNFDKALNTTFVSVRYDGEYLKVCNGTYPPKFGCDFRMFYEKVFENIYVNWMDICQIPQPNIEEIDYTNYNIYIVSLFLVNIVLIALVILAVFRKFRVSG